VGIPAKPAFMPTDLGAVGHGKSAIGPMLSGFGAW
jgi:hypothetical protein